MDNRAYLNLCSYVVQLVDRLRLSTYLAKSHLLKLLLVTSNDYRHQSPFGPHDSLVIPHVVKNNVGFGSELSVVEELWSLIEVFVDVLTVVVTVY